MSTQNEDQVFLISESISVAFSIYSISCHIMKKTLPWDLCFIVFDGVASVLQESLIHVLLGRASQHLHKTYLFVEIQYTVAQRL